MHRGGQLRGRAASHSKKIAGGADKILIDIKCGVGATLPDMESFAVVGATISDNFNVQMPKIGKSILNEIISE